MEYLKKIPAVIFAIVVIYLSFKAIRNALKFSDAGIFNFVAIVIFLIITVPPCRPYTERVFKWGWNILPAAVTQKEETYRLIESTICKPLNSGGTKIEGKKTRTDFVGDMMIMAISLVYMLISLVIILIFFSMYGIYHYVILAGCALLWRLYLFPPILGFFAFDIIHWAVNAPIIGIPAAFIFAPFDSVITRLGRKKMDFKLTKLRGEIIEKLDAIDRVQGSSIAINTAELSQVLNSSTLLTKWFRGWRTRVSSTLNQKAMESLTQSVNAYANLLESYERLGMQQHSLKTMGARQDLREQELLAEEDRINTQREKYKTDREVSRLTRLEAELDRKKAETELDKLRKKHDG